MRELVLASLLPTVHTIQLIIPVLPETQVEEELTPYDELFVVLFPVPAVIEFITPLLTLLFENILQAEYLLSNMFGHLFIVLS
ncbi:MAG: hypothetical protein QW292_08005 [Candidatus Parvarchaeota archaeon]